MRSGNRSRPIHFFNCKLGNWKMFLSRACNVHRGISWWHSKIRCQRLENKVMSSYFSPCAYPPEADGEVKWPDFGLHYTVDKYNEVKWVHIYMYKVLCWRSKISNSPFFLIGMADSVNLSLAKASSSVFSAWSFCQKTDIVLWNSERKLSGTQGERPPARGSKMRMLIPLERFKNS